MSTEQKKILARRFYEEVWVKRNTAAAFELVTPDCVRHDPVGPVPGGPEGFNANAARVRTGLQDFQQSFDLILAEGDLVAVRWTIRGTQTGPLGRIPPTGRAVAFSGVNIFRFKGGKIAEIWNHRDDLALYQQLGVMPPLPTDLPDDAKSGPN